MRIFGKHIFRSIMKKPFQPLMIILIIAISVAVAISMLILPIAIYRESVVEYKIDEWTDDLTVTLRSNADVRLLFEEDIAAAVGDKGYVLGEFTLNGILSSESEDGIEVMKSLSVAAVDLVRADSFYELRYIDYGKFTTTNIKKSAIMSERYADACGLSLGDSFTVTVLGREFTYTVQAIAMDTGIFNERDVLVDISGLREVLAERSPLIASLSNDFTPYTRVNIKLYDDARASDVKAYLEEFDSFADKKVAIKTDAGDADPMPLMRTVTVVIPGILLLIIAVVLIVSSLDLLQKQRRQDIALFKMVGADERHLNIITYLESFIYGSVGGIFGYIIAIPIASALDDLYGFVHADIKCGAPEAIFGLVFAVGFSTLCAKVNTNKTRRKYSPTKLKWADHNKKGDSFVADLILVLLLVIFGALACIISANYSYIAVIGFIFTLIALVYRNSPRVISFLASIIAVIIERAECGFGDLRLVTRSCKNSYPLKHAGRLMTIIISVFAAISFIISAINDQYDVYADFVKFDHIAVEADETTADMLRQLDGVDAIAYSSLGRNVMVNGSTFSMGVAVAGDVEQCFNIDDFPKRLPKGDEIAISRGVAKMIDANVGDEIECIIGDASYVLKINEIVSGRADFVFYDAEHIGMEYSMLCIRTDGSIESGERVRALLDERGVGYLSGSEFFAQTYEILTPQVAVISAMFYVMLIMTVLGIANVLAEQIMARSSELAVLKQNGKTKAGIAVILIKEVAVVLSCALIMSAVIAVVLCVAVDKGAVTFGMSIFK